MLKKNWNRLYLVRHGENFANLSNEFSYKIVNYQLTDRGKLQAYQTALEFINKKIDGIISSPLKRAVETANIIGNILNTRITLLENFREINVGELETSPNLLTSWEIHNQIIEDWLLDKPESKFPGGEDFHDLLRRAKDGIIQVLNGKKNKQFIIIGHAGIFTALIKGICSNIDVDTMKNQEFQNCSITILDAFVDTNNKLIANLESWASTLHLNLGN